MKTKIAVIGLGFVGGAVYDSLKNQSSIELVGIDPAKGFTTPLSEIKDFDGVFLCVPSPQSETGACDSRIFESVLDDLDRADFEGVIISKVTAPPNVYIAAQEKYVNLVHAPEFLTAANAIEDYRNGKFAIVGGLVAAFRNEAERLIRLSQPNLETVKHCSIAEASLAKYTINSFLATKVVFMNEIAQLTTATGGDWNVVKDLINSDRRIGGSHLQVPGPDGQYGFGGHCFPKDTSALLKYAESKNSDLNVLAAAVKKNNSIRSAK